MKTKELFILVIISLLLLSACGNNRRSSQNNDQTQVVVDSTYDIRNSQEYLGTYTGTLPCADCSGIRTEITLNRDMSYTMTSEYEGKEVNNNFMDSGTYRWDANDIIILDNDLEKRYQVGKNILVALDMHGNKITGELADMYIMKKK